MPFGRPLLLGRLERESVNALSGSAGLPAIGAAPGAAKGPGDCNEPTTNLCRLAARQLHRGARIESEIVAFAGWPGRTHENGPVQTKPPHNESRQCIELNAGLPRLEADDRVRRHARRRRERLEADALTLPLFA